ncbi:MAG: polymer-forming cytoskeletal protein [Candidatus Cloacimonetes bacterium]|nr:polymer-forming cytoskeletal protein [Candidatus Cloacimonadota bacterium]
MEKNRKVELSTIIGKGSRINGKLVIKGGIRIDGEIEGTIETDGFVLIGTSGTARANLKAKECLIQGKVEGDLYIKDQLELEKTAVVNGNIVSRTLRIHGGAKLNGRCSMSDSPKMPQDNEFQKRPDAPAKPVPTFE